MQPSDWYLAQLRPNQVERARTNLERQGYPCFLPRHLVTTRRKGRLVTTPGPLFPGYLFLHIGADRPWRPVNSTYGVVRLVMRAADTPQPVPESVIEDLFARVDADGMLTAPDDLAPGDEARVTAGPMAGFTARVSALDASGRVAVLLEMMGQAVRAEMPRTYLRRLAG